ncbi:hypothetical protein ABT352_25395 [Streptosporangium sp. NPDC000563]|uniref:hypothetical protein n=1 Tax=unclassified Streptosporangium TaxID=2632669 RepID=UPI00331D4BB0
MYGKRQLTVIGPTLLAALALGPVSFSYASPAPDPEQAVTVNTAQNESMTDPITSAETSDSADSMDSGESAEDPSDYWRGYRNGYRAAAQDCRRRGMPRSYAGPPSDYDRGWLDGYDAGYARFCWSTN